MSALRWLVPLMVVATVVQAADAPVAKAPFDADKAKAYQQAAAEYYGVPAAVSLELSDGVTLDFVLIPPGTFMMGSLSREQKRDRNESPYHDVTLTKPYYMSKCEISQEQWMAVFGGTAFASQEFEFVGDSRPADNVSGFEADKYAKSLSTETGKKLRLPTEAEWECACRAGTQTPFYTGMTISTDDANYDGADVYPGGQAGLRLKRTVDVGSYPPNPFGLHDMHGNVWEWCSDWYDGDFYEESPPTDPKGPPSGRDWVIRGGSYKEHPANCRSAERENYNPSKKNEDIGFRVVMEVDSEKLADR